MKPMDYVAYAVIASVLLLFLAMLSKIVKESWTRAKARYEKIKAARKNAGL